MSKNIRIGITQGDINGIGYEVILKVLADSRVFDDRTFIIYGSSKVAAFHKKTLNIETANLNLVKSAREAQSKKANIINCVDNNIRVEIGLSTSAAGQASIAALNCAVSDLKDNLIDVIVTAPINKKNINDEGFNFPGHTEFFASQFNAKDHLMLLVSDTIRAGVVTGHVPISEVPGLLTSKLIEDKIMILNSTLIQDFGIRKPRIAVLGLNPHAGDQGLLGKEEIDVIKPAIDAVKNKNIFAFGPFPADGFLGSLEYLKYDAVLGMYHDQLLIPFKVLAFDDGVNYTAGLSIIRTSPDHGTGFEIAGQNKASENSMRAAIDLAEDIFYNRKNISELKANQLKPQKIEE
ncbi:MAG: 4-hydroxythreonine-4-phosphate dehydrogenase PdxA [Bacteroidales bacterium]|nr:4-hydroxythreonine-4-phosphate dehydrogenase PdxA [Bacteroidales bacterium]